MWQNQQRPLENSPLDQSSEDHSVAFQRERAWALARLVQVYEGSQRSSLQRRAWSRLGFQEEGDGISKLPRRLLRLSDQGESLLPPESSLLEIFEDAKRELLLLGEPGVGKSTLLLELAHQLLARAVHDERAPLPALVPLSSWATQRLPLHRWLSKEISRVYDLPHRFSTRWVRQQQFFPLLDGLDEVDEAARADCVAALHVYQQANPGMLVVCSRTEAYTSATGASPLTFQHVVVVQPFSQEQVATVLAQIGQPLEALRQVLADNAALRQMTRTPLMFTICLLTYQEISFERLPQGQTRLQERVWRDYVQRMTAECPRLERYPRRQVHEWLRWLAQQMRMRHESIFFPESFQPDWLPGKQRALYRWSCRLVFGLLGGLAGGLIGEWVGVFLGALLGILGGIVGRNIKPVEAFAWSWQRTRSGLTGGVLLGLTGGLGGAVLYALLTALSLGPVISFFYMLFIGLPPALPVGVSVGVLGGLLGSTIYGFSRERPTVPAHGGMRRSAANGLAGALIGAFLGSLLGEVLGLLTGRTTLVLTVGLFGTLAGALLLGLRTVLQSLLLRFWLWQSHRFPWQAHQFLEDALDGLLLRRVGRGYSFLHALLWDSFTGLDTLEGMSAAPGSLPSDLSEPLEHTQNGEERAV